MESSRRDAETRSVELETNEVSGAVVNCALRIHQKLGPGLLESVYQRILAYELRKAGLTVETEVPVPVEWDGHVIDESFRADLIVGGKVLVELKSVERIQPVHKKQTLTYLKLSNLQVGLLINFGASLLKEGIHRIVNDFPENPSASPRLRVSPKI
ncbi:MAG: GxxExxY protein [Verrucomicrobia subdivision 3 bacterium]|nr:GxxExxY protein [Limisphaerales bacterium]